MNTNNTTEKKFNTTVTAFWGDDRFGEGAFRSAVINDEARTAMADIPEGSAFVLRPAVYKDGAPVLAKDGRQTYFLEILPPFQKAGNGTNKSGGKKGGEPTRNTDEDI